MRLLKLWRRRMPRNLRHTFRSITASITSFSSRKWTLRMLWRQKLKRTWNSLKMRWRTRWKWWSRRQNAQNKRNPNKKSLRLKRTMTARFPSCKISYRISTTTSWECKSRSVRRTWSSKVKMAISLKETKPSRTWKPKLIDCWIIMQLAIKPPRIWWDSWPRNKSNWTRPTRILSAWMAPFRLTIRSMSKNVSDWIPKLIVWTTFSKLRIMISQNRLQSSTIPLKNSRHRLLNFKQIWIVFRM